MKYFAVPDGFVAGWWDVCAEGDHFKNNVVIFTGYKAEERAREYAAWMDQRVAGHCEPAVSVFYPASVL